MLSCLQSSEGHIVVIAIITFCRPLVCHSEQPASLHQNCCSHTLALLCLKLREKRSITTLSLQFRFWGICTFRASSTSHVLAFISITTLNSVILFQAKQTSLNLVYCTEIILPLERVRRNCRFIIGSLVTMLSRLMTAESVILQ